MSQVAPADLPRRWRRRAALLGAYGAGQAARALRRAAAELDAALRAAEDAPLTLAEAAAESGYSTDRLRHMVADGTLPNAGRRGAPRIRRGDLPRRATGTSSFDPAAAAGRLLRRA